MESERITIRIPKKLKEAVEAKAGELSIGEYTRKLLERETGVTIAEHVPYFKTIEGKPKLRKIARTGGRPKKISESF